MKHTKKLTETVRAVIITGTVYQYDREKFNLTETINDMYSEYKHGHKRDVATSLIIAKQVSELL